MSKCDLNERKPQNSIIVLATLGVYLGLLVAGGAAPQVFAHSATTRNFELTDEIEIKDDLDKNPDDERSPVHLSLQNYLEDVEMFIAALDGLHKRGLFDPARASFDVGQATELPCVAANRVGSYTATQFVSNEAAIAKTLEWFSKRLTDGYSLGDCRQNVRLGKETHDSKFRFSLEGDVLTVEVSVKKSSSENARVLAADLANGHKQFKSTTATLIRLQIYEHTTFRAENDQVLVVTRLPRSGLIALLSTDA